MLPLVRFGLLPFAVSFFSRQVLVDSPLTADLGAWYATPTWIVGAHGDRPGHPGVQAFARRRPHLRPAPGGMTVTPTLRPRARPGHHVEPGDALRPRRPRRLGRATRVPADFPQAGRSRARSRGDLDVAARDRARGDPHGRHHGQRRRRHRRHQPARDDGALGQADRPARGAGDRLAEPRQRADLRSPEGRRARGADPPQDRPRRRRLLLGHQGHAPARDRARPARPRRARRHPVRHHRHVPDLAPHRRQAARDRRHQRQPHADVRHPRARLGRRAAAHPRRAAADAARRCTPRPRSTAKPIRATSASRSRSRASPAISRPRSSARRASRPAWRRTPTAPAASC